jgi:hypothetical protein
MGELLRGMRERVRHPRSRLDDSTICRASGWRLRLGCTDVDGGTVCPLCSQTVPTLPDQEVRHPVQVIPDHCA